MTPILLIAAAFVAPVSSPPAAFVIARPTGKWVVEFGDQHCVASHSFSSGADEVAVGLQPRPTTEFYSLWLSVPKTIRSMESAQIAVGGTPIESKGMSLQGVEPTGRNAYAVRLTKAELLRLFASGDLRVSTGKWSSDFPLSRLVEVQRTLDACVADLLASWGMSAQAQADLASFPKPEKEPLSYLSHNDYPRGALNRMASGTVEVRITVGADGKAKDCHLMKSSGDPDLDATTCAIFVKRPRYDPARTKRGIAIEGFYVAKLTWRTSS